MFTKFYEDHLKCDFFNHGQFLKVSRSFFSDLTIPTTSLFLSSGKCNANLEVSILYKTGISKQNCILKPRESKIGSTSTENNAQAH